MGKTYDNSIFSIFNFLSDLHILHNGYTICLPTTRYKSSFFLHNFTNTCYFAFLITVIFQVWSDTSLWFWFAFPWWFVVILNSFSCPCGFVYMSSLKKALSKSLTYLKLRFLNFFLLCCRSFLHTLEINPLSYIWGSYFLKHCNQEELILNLCWISFCDFNPHLATYVIVAYIMDLFWEITWAVHLWGSGRKQI